MIRNYLVRSQADLALAVRRSAGCIDVPIGEVLLAAGLLERRQLEDALARQRRTPGTHLGRILLDAGVLDPEQLLRALAVKFGMPCVRLEYLEIEPHIVARVPVELALRCGVMPLAELDGALIVAMENPLDADVTALVRFNAGHDIKTVMASAHDIALAHSRYYSRFDEHEALETVNLDRAGVVDAGRPSAMVIEREARKKPIVRLLNAIVLQGIIRGASDVNLRPGYEHLDVYYRIDGRLQHSRALHRSLHAPLISRAKIIGGMDIAEHRLPQEGAARLMRGRKAVDLRISVVPTVNGESLVVRILDPEVGIRHFDGLGLGRREMSRVRAMLRRPHGLFLVTGPTGAGKSTTLYALLGEVRKTGAHILTVEDPVEYEMDAIEQVQVSEKIGVTFAGTLRHFLRHDPDVIMIGEIRDTDTAAIAVRAAMTGHFVLSTLHTNDAPGTIARLIDMGLEPYLLASTLLGVMTQRLVRLNCPRCARRQVVNARSWRRRLTIAGVTLDPGVALARGTGCAACHHTGYAGRRLIAEVLPVTPRIAALIGERASSSALRVCAREQGMTTLAEDAWRLARAGRTSLEEVLAVAAG